MRWRAAVLIGLLLAAPVGAEFGSGPIGFRQYDGPGNAPEPTIGIPWNTDSVFYLAGDTTYRLRFDAAGATDWEDVTPLYQTPINLDPMLIADEDTGRVLAGGLLGPCSYMLYSDDDGDTWLPTLNMCSGADFDHQSIGIGPKPIIGNPSNDPSFQNAYYCGQSGTIGCAVSLDGGVTWTPPTASALTFVLDGCGGYHGHWRVSRVTGTAFLPVPDCGGQRGMIIPSIAGLDGTELGGLTGLTFRARIVEGSHPWVGGFDPSIGIGRGEGWLYYGDADHMGARIALSKDEGRSWEQLPDADGNGTTTWLDVGAFHDPPVVAATFADVQAGDDDRVAFSFLGLLDRDGDGLGQEYPDLYGCAAPEGGEDRAWHYFAAFSYDAGQNWTVHQITDHPVQVGGIWDSGGGDPCRNLLDFNDMDIDSQGRVHIGWADGCIDECWTRDGDGRYSQATRLFRQVGGKGLFAAADLPEPEPPLDSDGDGIPDDEDDTPFGEEDGDNGSPGIGAVATLGALLAVAVASRHRSRGPRT